MKRIYAYPEFKRKLLANPKWIARGLQVILDHTSKLHGPAQVTLTSGDQISLNYMVNQLAFGIDGGLPWTLCSYHGKNAVELVGKYAALLYKYYILIHKVSGPLV